MFYGIKSLAFLLHETKIGKGGGVDGRGGGEQETPSPSSWYRHLTSSCIISGIFCLQCRLSASWRGGHTLIVMLGEYCGEKQGWGAVRWGGEDRVKPRMQELGDSSGTSLNSGSTNGL